jgi:hypothetical protein
MIMGKMYKTLTKLADNTAEFDQWVEKYLNEGWEPVGGPTLQKAGHGFRMSLALFKDDTRYEYETVYSDSQDYQYRDMLDDGWKVEGVPQISSNGDIRYLLKRPIPPNAEEE